MFLRILIFLVMWMLPLSSFAMAPDTGKVHDEGSVGGDLVTNLASSLPNISYFNVSIKRIDKMDYKVFLNEDMKGIDEFQFKSVNPIKGDGNGGRIYIRFYLKIFTYKNYTASKGAFENLLESSDPDYGLSKGWEYIIHIDEKLFWLSAPCLLSEQNWYRLTENLKDSLNTEDSERYNYFECYCGLGCRKGSRR